jgi:hypothetical protein
MKKTPKPIKPDVATYFIAKRMERAGMLKPGQALMLAATVGLRHQKATKMRDKR